MNGLGLIVAFVVVLGGSILYRITLSHDPEGLSRRPPNAMHAHQDEWPKSCVPEISSLQSPIPLNTTKLGKNRESHIDVQVSDDKAELVDTGHTFQIRYHPKASSAQAQFEEQTFKLRQFHFHKPSEHLIDGKQYEMEAHFVFLNENKSDKAKALVLGIMILDGPKNNEIEKIWNHLPPYREGHGETKVELSDWKALSYSSELDVDKLGNHEKVLAQGIQFRLESLLPKKADFIIYNGSLTTPGCEEGIIHAVALYPIYMEHEQVEHFEGYYEGSNRDIQPVGDIVRRDIRRATVTFGNMGVK